MFENPEKPKRTRMKLIARFDDCTGSDGVASVVVRLKLKFVTNECTFDRFDPKGARAVGGVVKWLDGDGRTIAKRKPLSATQFYSQSESGTPPAFSVLSVAGPDGRLGAIGIANAGSYETLCRSAEGFTGWPASPAPVSFAGT